jgi:hypothetical protein
MNLHPYDGIDRRLRDAVVTEGSFSDMTHAQWHARVRNSLAMVERQPIRALGSLHKLLHQLHSESKKTAGDWHIEQTLEVISIVQSHQEDHRRAAETILVVADRHEQQFSYYSRGFVTACATAALEFASAGDRKAALRALQRARPVATGLRPPERLFRKAEKFVAAMPRRPAGTSRAQRQATSRGQRRLS